MSTHTKGPWRLALADHDPGAFTLYGDSTEPHGENMVIVQRGIGTPNGAEGIANARLIAAAPELLAALEEVVAIADRKTDAFDRAHAAIQKAKSVLPARPSGGA